MTAPQTPIAAIAEFVARLQKTVALHVRRPSILGVQSRIKIQLDRFGTPTVHAASLADATRGLGYMTARDRLFQMDLMRRKAAGRLSEIMGSDTLKIDIEQRSLGLHHVARAVVDHLPDDQRQVLQAYADGVNAYIAKMIVPPPEFMVLRYSPEAWTGEDSILVGLYIMQEITGVGEEENERMMTIMHRTLPAEVFSFLTPDDDSYPTILLGGIDAHRPILPVPVQALSSIRRGYMPSKDRAAHIAMTEHDLRGSNGWVIGKCKTGDGRAILANDMHLPLSVPNIWYRAALYYNGIRLVGLVLPGLPIVLAGSNGRVAWGSTNINGDFLDLVELDASPQHPNEYRTPDGWKPFEVRPEKIRIRGRTDIAVEVKSTIWGPVSPHSLLGHPVAIRWTALDPATVDIGWIHINEARTVEDAVKVAHACGGPPLNVMLVDSAGHVGWTLCGKIPVRRGFDGSVCQSWADGLIGWDGYIPPDQMPVVIDPASGFLVTANQRTVGKEYPYIIGHHYANGYRAHYVTRKLRTSDVMNEKDLFGLQLDTTSEFYNFYSCLILELTNNITSDRPLLREARQAIEAWDGRAELNSRGIGLLTCFREALAKDIFRVYLAPCKEADENFLFKHNFEDPLRLIISERHTATLPDPMNYPDWESYLTDSLEKTVEHLKGTYQVESLDELEWRQMNTTNVSHPLSSALPVVAKVLNMPEHPLPGCVFCPRVADLQHGASARMVVSPGHEEDGILHMPCGQSGQPLSRNYRDQHSYWELGQPLPFLPSTPVQEWEIFPENE